MHFELESDYSLGFFITFTPCILLASEGNNIKPLLEPPLLPIEHPHKTPPLTNLKAGGGVPDPCPPLNTYMQ